MKNLLHYLFPSFAYKDQSPYLSLSSIQTSLPRPIPQQMHTDFCSRNDPDQESELLDNSPVEVVSAMRTVATDYFQSSL